MSSNFVKTYRGSGRFTGYVCAADHTVAPPWEPGQVGSYVGEWEGTPCVHPETDGALWPDAGTDDEFWAAVAVGEHEYLGHAEPKRRCPACVASGALAKPKMRPFGAPFQ